MGKIKLNPDKMKLFDDPAVEAEVIESPMKLDDVGQRVEQMLRDLTKMQTQFSRYPVISEKAGWLKRQGHVNKLREYAAISQNEAAIAESQRKAAEDILTVLNEAGIFLRKVEDQSHELFHNQRMRDAEYDLKMAEVEKMKAEVTKLKALTEKLQAEADQTRALADRLKADVAQITGSDSGDERTIEVGDD